MLNWEIVHECDDEETGKSTLWASEINSQEYGKYVWISLDCNNKYNVEVKPEDEDYRILKTTRSLKSSKQWAEKLSN